MAPEEKKMTRHLFSRHGLLICRGDWDSCQAEHVKSNIGSMVSGLEIRASVGERGLFRRPYMKEVFIWFERNKIKR